MQNGVPASDTARKEKGYILANAAFISSSGYEFRMG